ncbi:MAG: adenylate/guanylate cyclase domain-containing protein [Myxococcales bacterium]|nr:adenylate/guanylate cyclase domain-containing protein [Myxococcales bacterium]
MSVQDQLLQEIDATIVLTDMRDFTTLAHQIGPVELALTLSGFYNHTGGICEKHGGRIVKFIGDSVLATFVGMQDHRGRALAEMAERRDRWMADNVKVKLPPLEYAASAASGSAGRRARHRPAPFLGCARRAGEHRLPAVRAGDRSAGGEPGRCRHDRAGGGAARGVRRGRGGGALRPASPSVPDRALRVPARDPDRAPTT